MHKSIPAATLIAVKTATKDLVDMAGGIHRAAQICGTSPTTVRRWYAERSDQDPEAPSFATIDAVSLLLLERDLAERGNPARPVTECLARLAGLHLTDDAASATCRSVAVLSARFAGIAGDSFATMMQVVADNVITPTEAQLADRKLGHVAEAVADLRGEIAKVRGAAAHFSGLSEGDKA